ncbi:MAG: cache and HAMP domain-containing protein [Candidatus Magasanikbacteria bacterium]|nr:cache and HAMP domain-containing protein [Candidatus Magasanikbacteria bacterium]
MFKNIKISTKLILFFLFVTIIPTILIALFSFNTSSKALLNEHLLNEGLDVEKSMIGINTLLKHFEMDVLILKDLTTFQDLLNTDFLSPTSTIKQKISTDFLNFTKKHDFYYQVRYLDETGQEIIRIEQTDLYKQPFLVSEENLQNKSARYYFKDTMKLAENKLFVSKLDLNIERGEIENRGTKENPKYVPTLRLAIPVFNDNGNRKGIIITNIYADIFLKILEEKQFNHAKNKAKKKLFLVNKDGYFLHNENKTLNWGFMFDNNNTIFNISPSIAESLYRKNKGQFYDKNSKSYITFENISIKNQQNLTDSVFNPDEGYWVLYSQVQKKDLFKPILDTILYTTIIIILIVLFTIILAFFLGRSITKPIHRLITDIQIIKEGNLKHKVHITGKDELGQLGKAINDLRSRLNKTKRHTERKISKRTEELDKLNNFLMGRELKMIKMKEKLKKIKKEDK